MKHVDKALEQHAILERLKATSEATELMAAIDTYRAANPAERRPRCLRPQRGGTERGGHDSAAYQALTLGEKTMRRILILFALLVAEPARAETYTLATQWPATGRGIATDATGNVYVAGGSRVQKYDNNGALLEDWEVDESNLREISLDDAGNIYLATLQHGASRGWNPSVGSQRRRDVFVPCLRLG